MIGLDTNILVRFMTQDDPHQSPIATEIFERRVTERNPGFVSVVAMAETAWMLERSYGVRPEEIAAVIERVLQTENLVVENEQAVFTAMVAVKEGLGVFADALIGALGAAAGCERRLPSTARPYGCPASRSPSAGELATKAPRPFRRRAAPCYTPRA